MQEKNQVWDLEGKEKLEILRKGRRPSGRGEDNKQRGIAIPYMPMTAGGDAGERQGEDAVRGGCWARASCTLSPASLVIPPDSSGNLCRGSRN